MNDCVFCRVISGELLSSKIYEDDDMLAILDIRPVTDGHTLIIPKQHCPQMEETPDDLLSRLFVRAKSIRAAVKKATASDYVIVSVVGEDVSHFHIHLIPRRSTDGLGSWPTKTYAEGEKDSWAEKIKAEL